MADSICTRCTFRLLRSHHLSPQLRTVPQARFLSSSSPRAIIDFSLDPSEQQPQKKPAPKPAASKSSSAAIDLSRNSSEQNQQQQPRPATPRPASSQISPAQKEQSRDPSAAPPRFTIRRSPGVPSYSTSQPPDVLVRKHPSAGGSSSRPPGLLIRRQPSGASTTSPPPDVLIRKEPTGASTTSRPPGLLIRKEPTDSSSPSRPPGLLIRRVDGQGATVEPSLLRRSTGPQSQSRSRSSPQSRTGGGDRNNNRGDRRPRKPQGNNSERRLTPEEVAEQEDLWQEYLGKVIDPSPYPTDITTHVPIPPTPDALRLDWPTTPLSPTGLSESIVQKLSIIARQIPHGYWTPRQIAERYDQGHLVRFESKPSSTAPSEDPAGEKAKTLAIVQEWANERASNLTARASNTSGDVIEPEDTSFVSLADGLDTSEPSSSNPSPERTKERTSLISSTVLGHYPTPQKGQYGDRKFLDGIAMSLRENSTYGNVDTGLFMDRVNAVVAKAVGMGQRKSA